MVKIKAKNIIAVDGPAGSGKGTISHYIETKYHLKHIDTGLFYRFLGYIALQNNIDFEDIEQIIKISENTPFKNIDKRTLAKEEIGQSASIIGQHKKIRSFVNNQIKNTTKKLLSLHKGIVVDGRDIGTVVFPDAILKLFITASPFARFQRRRKQNTSLKNYDYFIKRDKRDTKRQNAPLVIAKDAIVIDTTNLDLSETYNFIDAVLDMYNLPNKGG
ncbi:MAG: (d)CMP kinase [Alphaproteobacteria bacterium]